MTERLWEQLGEEVMSALRFAGWTPERMVSVEPVRQGLRQEGVLLHPLAERVLASLGGMELRGKRGLSVRFDALDTCRWIDAEDWPFIRALFSETACPIANGEGMLYLVSSEGEWMALHERWSVCYFIPGLDSVIRFALFGESTCSRFQMLARSQVPPGYYR